MTCECGREINSRARICPECQKNRKRFLESRKVPYNDRFGNVVMEVIPDINKITARRRWLYSTALKTKPQKLNAFERMKQEYRRKNTGKAALIFGIFCIFVLILQVIPDSITEWLAPIILTAIFVVPIALVAFEIYKYFKGEYKINPNDLYVDCKFEHDADTAYYVSNYCFGYTDYDHTSKSNDTSTDYYNLYEFEILDIKNITYDETYAEYIIELRRPEFTSYVKQPTNFFAIPDIFDDYVLSQALHCDLPPKNIKF